MSMGVPARYGLGLEDVYDSNGSILPCVPFLGKSHPDASCQRRMFECLSSFGHFAQEAPKPAGLQRRKLPRCPVTEALRCRRWRVAFPAPPGATEPRLQCTPGQERKVVPALAVHRRRLPGPPLRKGAPAPLAK
eukprot:s755_g29.t1